MIRILIIDDDKPFCELLVRYLSVEGFYAAYSNDGIYEDIATLIQGYDLILLDVMFPNTCGFDILKELRQHSHIPIIMLSSLNEDIKKIVGLESGADDYLQKNENPRLIIAKIHSVLRRTNPKQPVVNEKKSIELNALYINRHQRMVMIHAQEVSLTASEFDLLEFLAIHVNKAVSKAELVRQVFGKPLGPHDRSLDLHISRLRAKTTHLLPSNIQIKTIQSYGYQLCVQDEV